MRRNKKQIIAFMMAVVLSFGLTGCAQNKSKEDKNETKQVEQVEQDEAVDVEAAMAAGDFSQLPNMPLTIMIEDDANNPYRKDWMSFQQLEKRGNVTLNVQAVPITDFADKRKIVLNSGDTPDLILKTWANTISDFALSGQLVCISDYLDVMPNLVKRMEECGVEKDVFNFQYEGDGKLYVLPQFSQKVDAYKTWFIRKDLLDKHNLPMPETYEDLYQVLKELKAQYPDSTPFVNQWGEGNMLQTMCGAFGVKAGWSNPLGVFYDYKAETWSHAPTHEGTKELLQYLNKLYTEGLLDKEFNTLGDFTEKVITGNAFFMTGWVDNEIEWNKQGKELVGEEFNIVPLTALEGPAGKIIGTGNKTTGGAIIPIKVAKDPERLKRILQLMDWYLYSDEGAEITNIGLEGVTFERNADGTVSFLSDIKTSENPEGEKSLYKDFGINGNLFQFVKLEKYRGIGLSKERADILNVLSEQAATDDPQPPLQLDESEEAELISVPLKDYCDQMILKFIMGDESFDKWDDFVTSCQDKGSTRLMEIYNTAWARKNAAAK